MKKIILFIAIFTVFCQCCKEDDRINCNNICSEGFSQFEQNCHCYKAVLQSGLNWGNAQAQCEAQGGYLATITSEKENQFIMELFEDNPEYWFVDIVGNALGPWIGGIQESGAEEPDGGWGWQTGEEFEYQDWSSHDPDNCCGVNQNRIQFIRDGNIPPTNWTDVENFAGFVKSYIIEIE